MSLRKKIPPDTETNVLHKSRRRCALCFGLNNDTAEKKGQIAHISRDATRIDEDDLVYLCFDHHDDYDSKHSQSKGVTQGELRQYRDSLYEAVQSGRIPSRAEASPDVGPDDKDAKVHAHDLEVFRRADSVMSESTLNKFLEWLETDHSYYIKDVAFLRDYLQFFDEIGNRYLLSLIDDAAHGLASKIGELLDFLGTEFFTLKGSKGRATVDRVCLRPELNVGREGSGTDEETIAYAGYADQLHGLCREVREALKLYRDRVRQRLSV